MVMIPVPGRRRTRATAALRRPVDWINGFGTTVWCSLSDWLGNSVDRVVHDERLGALSGVRVGRPGVHLELLEHAPAERSLGQHAADGAPDRVLGALGHQVAGGAGPDDARIAGVG